MRNQIVLCFIILFILFPVYSYAQMFSVGNADQRQTRSLGSYSTAGISLEFADFDYAGENAPETERLDFESPIVKFRLEMQGLNISLGFGGSLTGMENRSYVNVGGRIFNELPVYRKEKIILAIPLQLSTDLKSVQKNDSNVDFQQSSFLFGSGISSFFRLSDTFDLSLRSTPNFGFSFSQGNLFGGNLFRLDGKSLLFIRGPFGENALSIGYHFDYRNYRIEGDLNDYKYMSHSVTLGYSF